MAERCEGDHVGDLLTDGVEAYRDGFDVWFNYASLRIKHRGGWRDAS
ncbi:MAG: hypothetical protein ACYDAQ_00695 [Mycobacteriales bacterium]